MLDYHFLWDVVVSVGIIAVSGLFFESLSHLFRRLVGRAGGRLITLRGIRDGLRLMWAAVAAWGLLWVWGLASTLTVLTVSGIAALAISLALQAVLTNMISGLLLVRDGALRIGDRIEYGGVKGRVVQVALRNTWVRTEAGSIAIIGNTALAGGPLVNHTAADRMAGELGLA